MLIRHGESQAQADGMVSGHDTCTGLSDLGRQQAAMLRDRLLATGELSDAEVVYTSILQRAIETGEIIAPAVAEVSPQPECDWCEMHAGEAEGLSYPEYRERYPRHDGPDDPFRRRTPGAETWAEFSVRAGTRLRRIADEHAGQHVVVVGHGGIVGASFVALGDLPIGSGTVITGEVVNTSLTEWRWASGRWRLVRFNDAAHLLPRP